MARKRRLRVYFGPDDSRDVALGKARETGAGIQIPLSDLIDTMVEAAQNHRTWLDDFRYDKVTISTDLYEVILAYQQYKRPSA